MGGEALQGGENIDVAMRVSASQLAPFALRGFCIDPAHEGESTLLRSAFTVQASLRCARPAEPSIVFAAAPLDVRVDCLRAAGEPAND